MASFLQKSTPWIEDAFVYASSFDPLTNNNNTTTSDINHSNESFNDDDDAHLFDSQQEPEPQTENTIPSGLLPSPEQAIGNGGSAAMGNNGTAPSRQSKIVQVIQRGGDFGYYDALDNEDDTAAANNNSNNNHQQSSSSCPPYLILHDGQHSAIAFLSPSTLAGLVDRCGGSNDDYNIPPNKSLISISHFTLSTILQCTSVNFATHEQILNNLCDNTPLIPPKLHRQLQHQINSQLFLCLYLQTPLTLIGAENGGMIGNPIDVHCSVLLRRVLMDHQKLHPNTASGLEHSVGYSHHILVGRLEACHNNYLLLALLAGHEVERTWPWISEFYLEGASVAANAAAAAARVRQATAVVVMGNVNGLMKGEFLEDVFGSDFEEGEERDGDDSPLRGHTCDLGNEFDNEVDGENDWREEAAGDGIDDGQTQNDKGAENDEGKETAVSSGEGNDDNHQQKDNEMEDVATNKHTAEDEENSDQNSNEKAAGEGKDVNHQQSSNETEEDAATDKHTKEEEGRNDNSSNEAAPGQKSNAAAPVEQSKEDSAATDDHTAEKEGNNDHTSNEAAAGQTTNNAVAQPVEQGNVAELFENFDNFDEIEDMFDLSSSNDESHLPLDGDSDTITVARSQHNHGSKESAEPTVDGGKKPPADVMAMAFPPLSDHDSFLENGVAADSITVAASESTGQQPHGREMAVSTGEEEEPTTTAASKKMAVQDSSTAQVGHQQQSGDNARNNGTENETSQLS